MKISYGLLLCLFYLASGCASSVRAPLEITSQPPGAAVEVNGEHKGTTPTTIQVKVEREFVGLANAPGGVAHGGGIFVVTVHPPAGADPTLKSRTKKIVPALTGGKLFFDLRRQPYEGGDARQ